MVEECGQVTVFLGLLLISFILALSVCVEGIYVSMQSAKLVEGQTMACNYAKANYHKELLEEFHIFAVDGRYKKKMETTLKKNIEYNTSLPIASLTVQKEVPITGMGGEALKNEILSYMKQKGVSDFKNSLTRILDEINGGTYDEVKSKVDQIQEADDTEKMEKPLKPEVSVTEDPRKELQQLLSKGILSLVMPEGKEVSTRKVPIIYGTENIKQETKVDFLKKESVQAFIKQQKEDKGTDRIFSDGIACLYVEDIFRCALDKEKGTGIQYEQEYLIAGKNSDEKNLKSVVQNIVFLRFCINYASLFTDTKRQTEAAAMAAAVCSAAGVVPGVIEGVKWLILAAWAYGESILEVRSLLKGNKIAVIKTPDNWNLSIKQLGNLSAVEVNESKGLGYQDYLKGLLVLKGNQIYLRMMDLMEQRIQEKQKDFQLSSCLYSFELCGNASIPSLFFSNEYQREWKISATYSG